MTSPVDLTPRQAWSQLLAGNARFMSDMREHPDQDSSRRVALSTAQRPFALLFGCSDSRVPAEIVFDQGLGSLFVVRTAGHVVDMASVGSIEFGIAHLGIPLIVVLGHQSCGAVTATEKAFDSDSMPKGFVRDLVERIIPSVFSAHRKGLTETDDVIEEHVKYTVDLLSERSHVVAEAIEAGTVGLVGAVYHLGKGDVTRIHAKGEV